MRCKKLVVLFMLTIVVLPNPVDAARQTRDEIEQNFKYGWSKSATLIFFGTIAAVEYEDNPKQRAAEAEVLVRVDSTQRGVTGNSMVRVRIEDELQTHQWHGDTNRIGETGIWFIHRVRQYDGEPPRGYLIRHMDQIEMDEDPQYLSELMKYVIQDTVDQTIRPNILNLLTADPNEKEVAALIVDLEYDEFGMLSNIEMTEKSGNTLFNDHVFDTVLQIHRRIRIPGQVKSTQIAISREIL